MTYLQKHENSSFLSYNMDLSPMGELKERNKLIGTLCEEGIDRLLLKYIPTAADRVNDRVSFEIYYYLKDISIALKSNDSKNFVEGAFVNVIKKRLLSAPRVSIWFENILTQTPDTITTPVFNEVFLAILLAKAVKAIREYSTFGNGKKYETIGFQKYEIPAPDSFQILCNVYELIQIGDGSLKSQETELYIQNRELSSYRLGLGGGFDPCYWSNQH